MDRIKELKKVFKDWGVAKTHNSKLTGLAPGTAVIQMKVTEDGLTPHTKETRVLFGGYHPMLANMAGAMGVYSLIDEGEEPLLVSAEAQFTEPVVREEKYIIGTARVAKNTITSPDGREKKNFEAHIEVTNAEGALKALIVMHYTARPIELRKKNLARLRQNALNYFSKARS